MDESPTLLRNRSNQVKIDRNKVNEVCLSCPASLVCLQFPLLSVEQCDKCGNFIAYFEKLAKTHVLTRIIIPDCLLYYPPNKIFSCLECADEYEDEDDDE